MPSIRSKSRFAGRGSGEVSKSVERFRAIAFDSKSSPSVVLLSIRTDRLRPRGRSRFASMT
jgi:hypothetical protein